VARDADDTTTGRAGGEAALRERIAALEAELAEARREAVTCALTGLLNRRGWDRRLAREESRCRRHGLDAVVCVVDLDRFKAVNDADGHAAGDGVLVACARALEGAVRGEDVVARPGGDEFALLAVQTRGGSEPAVALRVGAALARAGIRATIGAACRSETGELAATARLADERMLAAKRGDGDPPPRAA
jgi:diguanylate cyclase